MHRKAILQRFCRRKKKYKVIKYLSRLTASGGCVGRLEQVGRTAAREIMGDPLETPRTSHHSMISRASRRILDWASIMPIDASLSSDSRCDIFKFGCVGFREAKEAFNKFISKVKKKLAPRSILSAASETDLTHV